MTTVVGIVVAAATSAVAVAGSVAAAVAGTRAERRNVVMLDDRRIDEILASGAARTPMPMGTPDRPPVTPRYQGAIVNPPTP